MIKGIVTSFRHDSGSMSAPAFTDIIIKDEEGETWDVYAQGKLAKQLVGKLTYGLSVAVHVKGSVIITFESFE